jgi:prolipoprotein diacylglyceryltransferase
MLIAGVTFSYFWIPHAPGRGFALMLVLEGAARFVIESLRVEPAVLGRLSYSMVISVGLVALGVVLWFAFGRRRVETSPAFA